MRSCFVCLRSVPPPREPQTREHGSIFCLRSVRKTAPQTRKQPDIWYLANLYPTVLAKNAAACGQVDGCYMCPQAERASLKTSFCGHRTSKCGRTSPGPAEFDGELRALAAKKRMP